MQRVACGVQFVQSKPHPEFRGLVLDDEQQLVMRGAQRVLGIEHGIKAKVIGIGHAPVERHLRAIAGGIVGIAQNSPPAI